MPHPVSRDLLRFLKPYPTEVRETALALREWLWKHFPESNELLYDNYNAVVIGFAVSENASGAFCSVAVYAGYVNFGLLRGREIADAKKLLSGNGRQYRKMSDSS